MNKFLKIFGVFCIIVLALAYVGDYIITTGLKKTDLRVLQAWNDIYSSNIKSDLVIVGNSRAWCNYSPHILDSILTISTYNLGIDGHTIDYQVLKYETYRRFNPAPRYIIQNIDPFTSKVTAGAYEREQFFPFISDDSVINYVEEVKKISLLERYLPLVRYWSYRQYFEAGILSYFGSDDFSDGGMFKGYRGNDWPWSRRELDRTEKIVFTYQSRADEIFRNYLTRAKADNIQVIFVYAPIYIEGVHKIENLSEMYAYYEDIAKEYEVPVFNYISDSINLDSLNFYNATHLNKKGSELFSNKLAKDLHAFGIK